MIFTHTNIIHQTHGSTPLWIIFFSEFFRSLLGNSLHSWHAIGFEYRPLVWLPLGTGFSYTQADRIRWSAGAGLDFGVFGIDLGTENVRLLSNQGDYDLISAGIAMTAAL